MPSINDLLAEFDEVIEKRAAAAPKASADQADDVVKLAERLVRDDHVKTASAAPPESLVAEIAKSLAITETLLNLPTLAKVASVEERARAAGHSEAQIGAFLEKNASAFPMVSVLQLIPWL